MAGHLAQLALIRLCCRTASRLEVRRPRHLLIMHTVRDLQIARSIISVHLLRLDSHHFMRAEGRRWLQITLRLYLQHHYHLLRHLARAAVITAQVLMDTARNIRPQ